MLVHICCAVDSHFFLQKLKNDYPDEKLIGFFYDPNIHPYSEYYLRLLEVRRSCRILGIELIEGEYDMNEWLNAVRGLEGEPEKGARCSVCFDHRFEKSAQKAVELGDGMFTSTLLTSPKKSLKQLKASGDALAKQYKLEFVAPDYRKASGAQEQNIIVKESRLYRQDYCGCIYALGMQREEQDRLSDELMSPISGQMQPESIDERIDLYEKRIRIEELGVPYTIIKHRFLNWRLKAAVLSVGKKPIVSHILPYSTIKKGYTRGRIGMQDINGLYYLGRDEVKFLTIDRYNILSGTSYTKTQELLFSPPSFETEVDTRNSILESAYDLSAIVVVDEIPKEKIELILDSVAYEDVRELLRVID
jgi:predicted adenine nucleotide alpha hydrolase (AANH) superfamily ATPase